MAHLHSVRGPEGITRTNCLDMMVIPVIAQTLRDTAVVTPGKDRGIRQDGRPVGMPRQFRPVQTDFYSKLSDPSCWLFSPSWPFTPVSTLSCPASAEPRARLRRATGDASRIVSAAFLRVPALGDLRIATAASLRAEAGVLRATGDLRAVGVLRVAVGFAAALRVLLLAALGLLAVLTARGLRVVATGLATLGVRAAVVLVAVLRPVAAVTRDLLAVVLRVVTVVRAAPRLGAAGFAVRVEARAVDFAAVARVRAAGAAAALRAGALRVAAVRLVVARVVAALVRVVGVLVARGVEVLEAARVGVLVALAARVAAGLVASFLAAVERAAGLLAVRIVRDVAVRPVVEAVRRPPALTAMALVRRPGVLLLSSLLMA